MQGFVTVAENQARIIAGLEREKRIIATQRDNQYQAALFFLRRSAELQGVVEEMTERIRRAEEQVDDLRDENEYLRGRLTELCYPGKEVVSCRGGIDEIQQSIGRRIVLDNRFCRCCRGASRTFRAASSTLQYDGARTSRLENYDPTQPLGCSEI